MLPWSPETIVEVSALYEGQTIATVSCDAFHPMLAANGLLPTHRGFTLDLSNHPDGKYILHFVADGERISSRSIHKTPFSPFILRDSGCDRRGTCFVIPNPRGDVQQREEARSILLLAAAAAEAGGNPTTIVIADPDVAKALELRAAVADLIGSVATEALAQAEFVALPLHRWIPRCPERKPLPTALISGFAQTNSTASLRPAEMVLPPTAFRRDAKGPASWPRP